MSNFYCAAPWRGLHINPRGDVKTCCAGDPNMLGNLNTQSIDQILNSELMQEIRSQLSQGRAHSYCSNCVQAERFGSGSERNWHNNVNSNFDYASAGTEYHYPVIIDVRWNTTCNLSCNYCMEYCSSKWASIKGISVKSGARPYYEQVCDFIQQHQQHIHEVALVGGEPLLLPENERLLDAVPQDVVVTLITNMSVDLESNKIFHKLAKRNKVGWSMSFDNVGQRFEYVRHGADWELLKHNLKAVKNLINNQGHWGGIHAVYNMYSATRLCELAEFAAENSTSIVWQNLFQPEYLDPFLHGRHVATVASQEIEKLYQSGLATTAYQQFFDQALNNYSKVDQAKDGIESMFANHVNKIETVYHPDKAGKFLELWPELSHLCQ